MFDELLFSKHDMLNAVHSYPHGIAKDVKEWPKNKVLGVPTDDLIGEMIQKYQLIVPQLFAEDKHISQSGESTVPVRSQFDDYGRGDGRMPVETVTISIPFEGDRDLFFYVASTRNFNSPRATVTGNQVSFTIFDRKLTAESVKAQIDRTINDIEMHLGWLRKDADEWNAQLQRLAREAVEQRKNELMERDNVVASLGIPLTARANPAGFQAVSLQRKPRPVTVTTPTPKAAFTPEPALNTTQYEEVMKAINRLATVIERSPATFAKMGETEIRDIVLVNLNADFDRHASGETFNAAGKTDILVSENGKNVFIAECKIWGGPKAFLTAIDQLQSYATWRDSKTALLIFSHNTDFTGVLTAIRDSVPTHPKFKKQHSVVSETETRYILRHKDDDSKEMLLAVSVFHIPDGNGHSVKR
jgi:hypothetical protein